MKTHKYEHPGNPICINKQIKKQFCTQILLNLHIVTGKKGSVYIGVRHKILGMSSIVASLDFKLLVNVMEEIVKNFKNSVSGQKWSWS